MLYAAYIRIIEESKVQVPNVREESGFTAPGEYTRAVNLVVM